MVTKTLIKLLMDKDSAYFGQLGSSKNIRKKMKSSFSAFDIPSLRDLFIRHEEISLNGGVYCILVLKCYYRKVLRRGIAKYPTIDFYLGEIEFYTMRNGLGQMHFRSEVNRCKSLFLPSQFENILPQIN